MSPAKTNAERQRNFRLRKAYIEEAEVRGIFAHPEDHAKIKRKALTLAKARERKIQAPRWCLSLKVSPLDGF